MIENDKIKYACKDANDVIFGLKTPKVKNCHDVIMLAKFIMKKNKEINDLEEKIKKFETHEKSCYNSKKVTDKKDVPDFLKGFLK